jgi:hypothetical protein
MPPDIFAGPPRPVGASRGRIRAPPSIRPRLAKLGLPRGCCTCVPPCGTPAANGLGHAGRLKLLGGTGGTAPVDLAGSCGIGPACSTPAGGRTSGSTTRRPIESRPIDRRGPAAGLWRSIDFFAARGPALAVPGASPRRWRASTAKPGTVAMPRRITSAAIKHTIFKTRSLVCRASVLNARPLQAHCLGIRRPRLPPIRRPAGHREFASSRRAARRF